MPSAIMSSSLPRQRLLATAIALSCGNGVNVWADTNDRLEQVLVEGRTDLLPDATGDIAGLLQKDGVQFYAAGGVARLPVLRGLNDDRIKLLVDGAETTSACANHMNPALSYMDASRVTTTDVIAGLTPVSVGGDSIAGTIIINSEPPRYADSADKLLTTGSVALFYKSNNRNHSEAANATLASDQLSLTYSGSNDRAESYRDGHGDKVLDTLYRSESHSLTLGARAAAQELIIKLTHQEVPYQGFPNQYMDMVGNVSNGININYLRDFDWGRLDSRLTWQEVDHEMGFFTDEKSGTMPMLTEGQDTGYSVKAEIPLSAQHSLRLGNEYHHFALDDWWPAVTGSMMMGPDAYVNINDGEKTRYALWAESDYQINAHWKTLAGIRYEHVITDTDDVQPYNTQASMMMPNLDASAAAAFNSRNHKRTDDNLDLTLLARYEPNSARSIEFGYARKTRSPNLYERYSWGQGTMAMTMIGWFGDGNGYVGAIDLAPEIAHTLSTTLTWRDPRNERWELAATPYYTYVDDFIDATPIGTFNPRMVMDVTRPRLQFSNQDAELYGVEIKAQRSLWDNSQWGKGQLRAQASYNRGERRDSAESLYHIMPLNFSVSLEQSIRQWTHSLELQWVDDKNRVDPVRLENPADSYTLVNIGTRYAWQQITLSLGVRNLFDEYYDLPLGGVSLAQWRDEGMSGQFPSLSGEGRSVDLGVRYQF